MESNKVKTNKQKLKESKEKYRLIIESISDPLHVVDAELKIIYLNPAFIEWLKSLGLNHEIIGKTPAEAFPFIGEKVTKEYQEIFNSKKEQFLEDSSVVNNKRIFTETKKIPILKSERVIQIITIVRDVTERKKIELKLRESEEKYRELANLLPQVICETDTQGNLTFVNQNAYKVFGYTQDDFNKGLNALQMISPKDRERTWRDIKKVLNGEEIEDVEYMALRKDGSVFPVIAYASPIIQVNKSVGLRIILIDASNLKKIEEELRESEEKYRYFFNNAQVGLFWSRISDGKFIECNNTFAKLVGFDTREECLADYIALEHYVDLNSRDKMLEEIRINNEVKDFEIQVTKRDGTPFWASISARTDLKENRIEGVAIDITARKKAEQKLRESEEKYRHLFETSPYVIGLLNGEGILIDCNDSINDILSIHTIEDVKGKDFKELLLLNEKNKHLIPIFEKLIKSIFEGVNQEKFDFRLNLSIGGHLWIHIECTLIEIENQELIQFIMQDITERKRSEQVLQETIEDLARINAELEQFTYVASHDLKEPLRMISSFAQLLEKHYKDKLDEDANDFIRFITEGVVRMQDLINNLLDYSKIGKSSREFEKVDLNDVLKDVIDNLRQIINETNAEIIYDSLPSIYGDKYHLLQVFQNLISNAIKFRGIDFPLISISAKPDGKHWVFSISDNGIGIDSKDFERIFIIFKRLHITGKYEGTGIGLAICKKIVGYHRGKIWVESEVGKGSNFYFSIPKEIDIKN